MLICLGPASIGASPFSGGLLAVSSSMVAMDCGSALHWTLKVSRSTNKEPNSWTAAATKSERRGGGERGAD